MGLTGKGRSSLYRDMAKGRLSYRSEADGGRSLETSELIRVYGALRMDETPTWDGERQLSETGLTVMKDLVAEIKSLREEVAGLKQELQEVRRLEYRPTASETPESDPQPWWRRWFG
ncbi:entry exclusion protein 1 [Dickeya oryzae]|uniref:entry exclusion protein 1 n=1 Tax=Dickeya oryzae TaxID=1240404 RepID=UPI001FEE55C1|nr:entry exclusion protein 1 [Dickeya oryzae]